MGKTFVRQKSIYCGRNRKQVKVYNHSDEKDAAVKGRRNRRTNVTPPKQRDLNDRYAKEFFAQLVISNFTDGDYLLHATYAPEYLPDTFEDARKSFYNFMKRVEYRCKKQGLEPPKWINVTERGQMNGNTHHHCFFKCGLTRDEIENLWRVAKKKGEKEGRRIGYINTDRLQGELDAVIAYVAKDFTSEQDEQEQCAINTGGIGGVPIGEQIDENKPKVGRKKNQRRWTQSQNLVKPQESNNNSAWSRRELERAAKEHVNEREYWEKRYPGWTLVQDGAARCRYNDETGWSLDIKLKRKDVPQNKTQNQDFRKARKPKKRKQTNAPIDSA